MRQEGTEGRGSDVNYQDEQAESREGDDGEVGQLHAEELAILLENFLVGEVVEGLAVHQVALQLPVVSPTIMQRELWRLIRE